MNRISYHLLHFRVFALFKRVIVTPAVNPRLVESLHIDIQSTGQKSHWVKDTFNPKKFLNALFLLNSRIPLVSNSSKLKVNEYTK